jgi:hypothetical protein
MRANSEKIAHLQGSTVLALDGSSKDPAYLDGAGKDPLYFDGAATTFEVELYVE